MFPDNLDNLSNPLPEWRHRRSDYNKDEAWKWKEELAIAEALYNQ